MDESSNKPILVKLVLLGSLGVGKSAMTVRFLTKRFIGEYDPNIGSVYHHTVCLGGQEVNVHILDLGGELTECQRMKEASILWGDAFLLVYSITSLQSFTDISCIIQHLTAMRTQGSHALLAIVANKTDAESQREVSTSDGVALAQSLPCSFSEISTSTSYEDVERVFTEIIQEAVKFKRATQCSSGVRRGPYSKIKNLMDKHVTRGRAMSSLRETIDEYCVTRSAEDFLEMRDRSGTCRF
ncbi:ras-related and estrogen-regulated growth inhibitor [Nematostella vectensis]|uniref:ras-related and estrogen-regulated growth inhibitor n=1 Tax=Nematostella vectensis TaxID=45351 RepID=UPI0020776CA4|nr:ras-related and estrogen-regulated growth inhibitor [Nematostella vectensis]